MFEHELLCFHTVINLSRNETNGVKRSEIYAIPITRKLKRDRKTKRNRKNFENKVYIMAR